MAPSGDLVGRNRDDIPRRSLAFLAQRWKQASENQRRLAATRCADDRDEGIRLHFSDEFADRVVAAAEEWGVLLSEGLEAPVWADLRPNGGGCNHLAAKCGAERGKAVRLLKNTRRFAEIDPGLKLQKAGWRRFTTRDEHRNHRERGLVGLTNQGELALILLGVADPMLAKENGDGAGAVDGLFERRDPRKPWAEFAAVKEGGEALAAKPSIQFRRGGGIAAGVADKYVVVAASHIGSRS